MNTNPKALKSLLPHIEPKLTRFAQTLLQTPSLSGHEDKIAALIRREMTSLGYDDVSVDRYGSVIGLIKGGSGPSMMFNGHMDYVDPGDERGWPHPPHSGKIVDGQLWGRGAVDMKGPLACMIYILPMMKALNLTPPGDIYVTAVVMEEQGGIGTSRLAENLRTDLAVVGEPSRNILRRGHRGRVELWATFTGKSIHASIPKQGINPHFSVAKFISQLESLKMTADETFGLSSVAPTLLTTDQTSPNVTPGQITLTLDWRNIPAETPEQVVRKLSELQQRCLLHGTQGSVALSTRLFTSYTGLTLNHPAVFPSFALDEDDPLVTTARTTLAHALNRPMPVDIWRFATDGGHLMAAGIPTVGFGPGDETLAHTNQEHIAVQDMLEALMGYTALAFADWSH